MSTVIKVENLSKRYRLGQLSGRTLTEDVNRWWARVRHNPDPYLKIGAPVPRPPSSVALDPSAVSRPRSAVDPAPSPVASDAPPVPRPRSPVSVSASPSWVWVALMETPANQAIVKKASSAGERGSDGKCC